MSTRKIPEWISRRQVAEMLETSEHQTDRLLSRGVITSRKLPGGRPKFLRSDVERIANEAIRPAAATA